MALFFVLIVRKSNDEEIEELDDDITKDTKLKKDEEWLHDQPVCLKDNLNSLFKNYSDFFI